MHAYIHTYIHTGYLGATSMDTDDEENDSDEELSFGARVWDALQQPPFCQGMCKSLRAYKHSVLIAWYQRNKLSSISHNVFFFNRLVRLIGIIMSYIHTHTHIHIRVQRS